MDRRHPFDPIPDGIDEQPPRTQRAYREAMAVLLACAGGRYTVHAASGNTYDVDIAEQSCTCPDQRQNGPDGGCKHIRRVTLELQAKQVPTPDGRIPNRPAADGGHVTADGRSGARGAGIQGPILEVDANGDLTGAEYYRCRACGTEAMRELDLDACCTDRDS